MSERFRFLLNPSAGGGVARSVRKRLGRAARELGAELELSSSAGDLTERARRAVDEGVARLVIAGGDGTVHLALQAVATSDCEVAVVPTGRGDDFAHSLGVPARTEAAIELARDGTARGVDLLRVARVGHDPIWVCVFAGVGYDSAVTRTANAQPRWIPRRATYVLAALRTLLGFSPPRVTVEYEGGSLERRAMFVTACNAPRFGGGMRIAPDASLDDGQIDLVSLGVVSVPALLSLLPKVYRGRHLGHPAFELVRTGRVLISADPEALLGADGEVMGEIGSAAVEITAVPRAVRVVRPV